MKYRCLKQHIYRLDKFSLVTLRNEDKFAIMKWRNEQIYHLRQNKPLTAEDQNNYFSNVVSKLFEAEQPNQILFSYLENDVCIGYGGLVHINWIDKNAEISFIMNTELEEKSFHFHWTTYLSLIEQVAFEGLGLHKIYTYAFDLRPKLYKAMETTGFEQEAKLKKHCFFDEKYIDVLIHSKINPSYLTSREALIGDIDLFFKWTNEIDVRNQSYNSEEIEFTNHKKWFEEKIADSSCHLLVFENGKKQAVGQVRIQENNNNKAIIGVSIDKNHRGKKHAKHILKSASEYFLKLKPNFNLSAYIKEENVISKKVFENAGYHFHEMLSYKGFNSFHYRYKNN
jgi:RimJ/RimL family protein N-acetyltransferase